MDDGDGVGELSFVLSHLYPCSHATVCPFELCTTSFRNQSPHACGDASALTL